MARIWAKAPYERERDTQRDMTMHKEAAYKNTISSSKVAQLEVSGKFLYKLKC